MIADRKVKQVDLRRHRKPATCNYVVILLTSFMLANCASNASRDYKPADLVGVWVISHDPGGLDYSFIEYREDGKKCEYSHSLSVDRGVDMTFYLNEWKLRDGVIYTTLIRTNSILPGGRQINDRIELLTDNQFTAVMIEPATDQPELEQHFRHTSALPGRVCDLVLSVMAD